MADILDKSPCIYHKVFEHEEAKNAFNCVFGDASIRYPKKVLLFQKIFKID